MVMELRLAVLFGLCCFALLQVIESSGLPSVDRRKPADSEHELVSSGSSPDDEEGDVDDGSGSPNVVLEGSGGGFPETYTNITRVTHPPLPPLPPTTTKFISKDTHEIDHKEPDLPDYGSPNVDNRPQQSDEKEEEEEEREDYGIRFIDRPGEDHNVLIEDSSTTHVVPILPTTTTSLPKTDGSGLSALFGRGIVPAIAGGFVVGILAAILLVTFIVFRMKKKDEGSYALDEQKQPPYPYAYQKAPTKEFYA